MGEGERPETEVGSRVGNAVQAEFWMRMLVAVA
jgi:hypothetical protein